jgi:hypothetical protein
MRARRLGNRRVGEQPLAHGVPAGELEPVDTGAEPEQCPASRPAGEAHARKRGRDQKQENAEPDAHAETIAVGRRGVKNEKRRAEARRFVDRSAVLLGRPTDSRPW